MKKVTIRLDDDTFANARAAAAERNISLSRYIAEVLGGRVPPEDEYEAAYRKWRQRKPFPLQGAWQPYPKREELHERGR